MVRIKSNYDIFALRGDAWDANLPPRSPRLSPSGQLRLPLNERPIGVSKSVPHGDQSRVPEGITIFQFQKLDLARRLQKERNHARPPEVGKALPARSIAAAASAKLLNNRRKRHVKV
jgi:hypothetical protein